MVFAAFTGELFYGLRRYLHQPLGAGNLLFDALGVDRGLLFQRQQSDIDSQQRLGDFILQVLADLPSLPLLRRQNPVGQELQMFLQGQ